MIKLIPNVRHLMCGKNTKYETFWQNKRLNILGKVEVEKMTKEIDLKEIVKNLSTLGVKATVTKSRLELLKVLTPPTQTPQTQNV